MTHILILAGACGEGPGSYDAGVFRMPDGTVRGIEDVTDLTAPRDPDESAGTRRGGITRGLRDALAASFPLPRPFGLAASVLDVGLDLLGGDGRSGMSVDLRFADGAMATIRTDAAQAAQIERDREVVRLAALRLGARPALRPPEAPVADIRSGEARPASEEGPDARALASIFAYEKRGGRLRRLAAKAPDGA